MVIVFIILILIQIKFGIKSIVYSKTILVLLIYSYHFQLLYKLKSEDDKNKIIVHMLRVELIMIVII